MKIVNASYINTKEFNDPQKWLSRISFFTGILEELGRYHEVHSIEQINYEGELKRNNVQYHFLNFRKPKLYFPWRLHRYIKKLKPDVIFINGLIFPLQVIQLRIMLGSSVRIVVIHHAEHPFKGVKKVFQKMADKVINAYTFTSLGNAQEWLDKKIISSSVKCNEIVEVSTGFTRQNKYQCRRKLQMNDARIFLWVGNLIARKDPLTILMAFNEYLQREPNVKLYMIYRQKNFLERVKELIAETPVLQNAVKLVGEINHEELPNWYTAADFFFLGSHSEGSGTALIEAMACGCIPVVTDIPPFRKITNDGKLAFLSSPGNIEGFLESMKKTGTIDIEEFSNLITSYFEKELSFRSIAEKFDQLCQRLNTK